VAKRKEIIPGEFMDFKIITLNEFEVMGREYELSNSLNRNMMLAQKHWQKFNMELRKNKVHLGRNWIKYAFVYEDNGELYYYIAVPKKEDVSFDFKMKTIPKSKYLMVEHNGNMNKLKSTVDSVYNNVSGFKSSDFAYFEKYDYKFHWNRKDSIIELYFPIK